MKKITFLLSVFTLMAGVALGQSSDEMEIRQLEKEKCLRSDRVHFDTLKHVLVPLHQVKQNEAAIKSDKASYCEMMAAIAKRTIC